MSNSKLASTEVDKDNAENNEGANMLEFEDEDECSGDGYMNDSGKISGNYSEDLNDLIRKTNGLAKQIK